MDITGDFRQMEASQASTCKRRRLGRIAYGRMSVKSSLQNEVMHEWPGFRTCRCTSPGDRPHWEEDGGEHRSK